MAHVLAKELREAILQAAFEGKLSSFNNNDTPVYRLLEMIRNEKCELLKKGLISKTKPLPEIEDDEPPFDIPEHWVWERWGNLSNSIQYGANAGAISSGVAKLVRISDIQNNKVVWDTVPFCSLSKEEAKQYELNENDILFARTGGTVGKSVVVKNIPNDGFIYIFAGYLIRSNYNLNIDYRFLKYFMESDLYWSQLKEGTIGSAQPNCNGKTLSKMIVPLPPIEEQARIVARVDELMAKIDEYEKLENELVELKKNFPGDMKAAVLQAAMQGKLTNIYDYVECEYGNMFEISGGSQPSKNAFIDTPKEGYIQLYQTRDYGEKPQPVYIPIKYATKQTKEGDILLARYGGSLGKVFWAKDGAYNVAMAKVIFNKPELHDPRFVYYYHLSPIYQGFCLSVANGRSAQAGFNKDDIGSLPYPLFTIEEQKRIVEKLDKILPLCEKLEKEIA